MKRHVQQNCWRTTTVNIELTNAWASCSSVEHTTCPKAVQLVHNIQDNRLARHCQIMLMSWQPASCICHINEVAID
ncbi:hypothetical protein ABBQ38_014994 [Trebouxia sp. C0009 RCD-2024]